jgi:hypothetical protein
MLKALSTAEDLMNDKAANKFIGAIAAELALRPVEVEQEAPATAPAASPAAAPLPLAASIMGGLVIAADEDGNTKVATSQGGAWFVTDKDTFTIKEDGGRTPEIGEAHSKLEDNTGIKRPATELPSKFAFIKEAGFLSEVFAAIKTILAGTEPTSEQWNRLEQLVDLIQGRGNKTAAKIAAGDMTAAKALKLVERLENELKRLYFEAKPVTEALGSRPVREGVEAIYRAYNLLGEASKALNKQRMQEEAEEQALEVKDKNKKKSSSVLFGLALAAEDEEDDDEEVK